MRREDCDYCLSKPDPETCPDVDPVSGLVPGGEGGGGPRKCSKRDASGANV